MNNNWIQLNSLDQLENINLNSNDRKQIIFKHSTRCYISSRAYKELVLFTVEKNNNYDFYYLDLLKHRNISDSISEVWSITHQSPQIIIIKNKIPIYNTSHEGITNDEMNKQIAAL